MGTRMRLKIVVSTNELKSANKQLFGKYAESSSSAVFEFGCWQQHDVIFIYCKDDLQQTSKHKNKNSIKVEKENLKEIVQGLKEGVLEIKTKHEEDKCDYDKDDIEDLKCEIGYMKTVLKFIKKIEKGVYGEASYKMSFVFY